MRGSAERISSRPLALRTARSGGTSRENGFGNIVRQSVLGPLQLRARRPHIPGNALFRFLERGLSGGSRGVYGDLALVQNTPSLGFLLGKHFGAGFLHRFGIEALFFMRSNAAGFRIGSGAFGALAALGEHALHGREKTPAHEQIEKKYDNDRGNSRQEQLTELVNNLH